MCEHKCISFLKASKLSVAAHWLNGTKCQQSALMALSTKMIANNQPQQLELWEAQSNDPEGSYGAQAHELVMNDDSCNVALK